MLNAFLDVFRAWDFIKQHKLRKYLNYSILINLLILVLILVGAYYLSGFVKEWLLGFVHVDYKWLKWLRWLVDIMIFLLLGFVYYKLYTFIVLTVSAPILATLAEKSNEILLSQPPHQSDDNIIKNIVDTIKSVLQELVLIGVMMLLSMLPIAGIVSAVSMYIINAYNSGTSMIAYHNQYIGLSPKEGRRNNRKHRLVAIGNGLASLLLAFLPIVGVLISPALATVGACISMSKTLEKTFPPNSIDQ